jgi:predicted O-methyltransferase YrrM
MLYQKYGYTMDKLNPTQKFWHYNPLKDERVFRECAYHNYHFHYARKFKDIRHKVKKVLEIGVFRGHSMLMWKDFFPNAQIYGVDIDYSNHHFGLNAFDLCKDEDRIKLFEMDACNPNNVKAIMRTIGNDVDIIIDDGSHHPYHQLFALLHYTDYLKYDGVFVVEDVFLSKYFDKKFLDYYNNPYNLYTDEKYFFDEVIQKKTINLQKYGFKNNDLIEKHSSIVNNWKIEIGNPNPYSINFQDINLIGNNKLRHFNNRQGVVFFERNNFINN